MKLDKIKFARLINWLSTQKNTILDEDDLHSIDALIDIDIPPTQLLPVNINDLNELLRAMNANDGFIPAIKAYRVLTGVGLKEAKEAIEKFRGFNLVKSEPATLGDILRNVEKN